MGPAQSKSDKFQVNSRVMVDYESFGQYADYSARNGVLKQGISGQECGCSYCQSNAAFCETY